MTWGVKATRTGSTHRSEVQHLVCRIAFTTVRHKRTATPFRNLSISYTTLLYSSNFHSQSRDGVAIARLCHTRKQIHLHPSIAYSARSLFFQLSLTIFNLTKSNHNSINREYLTCADGGINSFNHSRKRDAAQWVNRAP